MLIAAVLDAVAVGTPAFDADAATRAYLATFNGAARARSDAYFEGGYWLVLWNAVVGAGVAWAFLRLGWAARLSGWSSTVTGGRRWLATLVWALVFLAATSLATLPWTIYTDFAREHQYGMSNQNFGQWFGDWAKDFAISVPVTALIVMGIMAGVRRSPQRWWLYAGGFTLVVMAVVLTILPVVIEPLFNKYTPMADSPLRTSILKLAQGNGVPVTQVLVVDASRQTKRVSANVAGFGPTTRVALNDNLLNLHDDAGTLSVMGHETGHYVLNHSISLMVGFGVIIVIGFATVQAVVPALIARNPGWGVRGITDPAAVAVAVVVLALFFLVLTPVTNSLTRFHESQADYFGINASRAPDGFARMALRLGQYRKLEPTPFEEAVFFDHPSGRTRIHMSMEWKAAHLGEPGVQ
ncbi:M48 family metallopeptidase [Polymorphobacter sp. PAMC 29334]|uniref:M48 family metallopeptidase n=1 Tax=Polymorphobacter sp. PAMC 29334 TaxID=2862331 RepID=UPI001C68114E|nr:M48 family metallopeptidase [Polymorphobacter sp. PAMC 29334]QYE36175.1 M48 family metallopeptidase [Polymorphobacter sp. PAMC 29334]